MCTEVDAVSDDDYLFSLTNWALEAGLWNGYHVTIEDAAELRSDIEQRILQLFFSHDPSSYSFEKMAAQLAFIGAQFRDPETCSMITREIQQLDFSRNAMLAQAGFCKSVSKFWKRHKTEIIIGVSLVAVATTIVVVTACTAGTASGAAVAAGGAAFEGLKNDEEKNKGSKPESISANPGIAQSQPKPDPLAPTLKPIPEMREENSLSSGQYPFQTMDLYPLKESNPLTIPQSSSPITSSSSNPIYQPIVPPAFPERGNFALPSDKEKRAPLFADAEAYHPQPSKPIITPETSARTWVERTVFSEPPKKSVAFHTEGYKETHMCIGGINGMNNTWEDVYGEEGNANYLGSFTDMSIEWVYDHTNGPVLDALEIMTMNYPGCSPIVANELKKNWTRFHEANVDNPNARYLQIGHSKGCIGIKNGLLQCPKKVRDRVIVVTIAPGAIIPSEYCFRSFNYASKKDIVPFGELFFTAIFDPAHVGESRPMKIALARRNELIILEPSDSAVGMDHGMKSDTYENCLDFHIKDYQTHHGEYE